jgi:hypothetical protein
MLKTVSSMGGGEGSSNVFATDITVNGLTVGRGDGNVSTNTAFGVDAIGSPYISSTNINNVGVGYNALNTIANGVATLTNRVGGSGYDDGFDGSTVSLIYQSGTPIVAGGVFPTVVLTISGGIITNVFLLTKGYGFTNTSTVFTVNNADTGGVGSGFSIDIGSLVSATNNTALGYNAGNTAITNSNSVYVGSSATGTGTNEIVIGSNVTGGGDNTVVIGNANITSTTLRGTTNVVGLTATGTLDLTGSTSDANTINFGSNQRANNIVIGGGAASTTGSITIGRSTGAQTVNIATGVAGSTTRAVNIGTNGGAGSTTNITLGGTSGTTTTIINGSNTTLGLSTGTQTHNFATGANSAGTKTVNIGTNSAIGTTTNITIGATAGTSTTTIQGYFKPASLASAPTYVKGAVYFDTTLNKLCVGGATTWETITSV